MKPGLLIDDRLLVSQLTSGPISDLPLTTTPLWYYRACRAAVLGAGGQLSGPFARLGASRQKAAIRHLLRLRDDVALTESRRTVPVMAQVAERHPRLNVMNLQAVAGASAHGLAVALSPPAAAGVLPAVLDHEEISWSVIDPA